MVRKVLTAISLRILHNYFDGLAKLFSDLYLNFQIF